MKLLERRLPEEGVRLIVSAFIADIGGVVASVVLMILRWLMTYSFGSIFCYKGVNSDKYCFQEGNISSIIGKHLQYIYVFARKKFCK